MNTRILTLIGVMCLMTATVAPACDDATMADAGDAVSEPSQLVSSARGETSRDLELVDCFYDAERGHPACQL